MSKCFKCKEYYGNDGYCMSSYDEKENDKCEDFVPCDKKEEITIHKF